MCVWAHVCKPPQPSRFRQKQPPKQRQDCGAIYVCVYVYFFLRVLSARSLCAYIGFRSHIWVCFLLLLLLVCYHYWLDGAAGVLRTSSLGEKTHTHTLFGTHSLVFFCVPVGRIKNQQQQQGERLHWSMMLRVFSTNSVAFRLQFVLIVCVVDMNTVKGEKQH